MEIIYFLSYFDIFIGRLYIFFWKILKVGDTMLKGDLHSDGGIYQGNQSGGTVKLSTKENQGGGATSAQRSHPVVEGVGLPINDPVYVVDVDKEIGVKSDAQTDGVPITPIHLNFDESQQIGDMENANL
ncbi:uncharacterized protein LOC132048193 [Lycium ferocissimum]|uniref:uncharacterized protein LOC132048193 n=1 Tax=Lycium ferocissimum TaxID=112874 RepID=UPI002815BAC8|nr:uncharacterized protein LOC132048193 [Lycium ferocissimum]